MKKNLFLIIFAVFLVDCQPRIHTVMKEVKSFDLKVLKNQTIGILPVLFVDNSIPDANSRNQKNKGQSETADIKNKVVLNLMDSFTTYLDINLIPVDCGKQEDEYAYAKGISISRINNYFKVSLSDPDTFTRCAKSTYANYLFLPVAIHLKLVETDNEKIKSMDAAEAGIRCLLDYALYDMRSNEFVLHGQVKQVVAAGGYFDIVLGRDVVDVAISKTCEELAKSFSENMHD